MPFGFEHIADSFITRLNPNQADAPLMDDSSLASLLTDHHCDPPPSILPRREVRLRVQPPCRRHGQPDGRAARGGGGQRAAGKDEEDRLRSSSRESQKSRGQPVVTMMDILTAAQDR